MALKERYKSIVAVFLILTRLNDDRTEVLLQKRQNTGYMDDKYDTACSGHLDPKESVMTALVREAKEEIGITIREEDLDLAIVVHSVDEEYIKFFFNTNSYLGTPQIQEPEKCSDLRWFPIDNLPNDMVPHIKSTLENIEKGVKCDDGNFTLSKRRKN